MNSIFKMSMSFKMSLSHCCCESHCCMSHILLLFCKNQILFCFVRCKSMTNFDKLYKKIRENRYISYENVYIDKNKGKFDTNLSIVTPPDRYL